MDLITMIRLLEDHYSWNDDIAALQRLSSSLETVLAEIKTTIAQIEHVRKYIDIPIVVSTTNEEIENENKTSLSDS